MKRIQNFVLFAGLFIFALSAEAVAQGMMKKDERAKAIVAVISAEWCPYCKNVEPVMMGLMKDYGEKLSFIVLDVTNAETSKEAMRKAEAAGLGDFFKQHKGKTSTVAVLKENKILFKTSNNTRREDYEKAFADALR